MADIDIVQKRGRSMWTWVLLLIALAVLVFVVMALLGSRPDDQLTEVVAPGARADAAARALHA